MTVKTLWTKHANGWVQLRVPLPFSLKWINSYLLPGQDGWTVIDPGLRTRQTEQAWEEAVSELGLAWDSITQIMLTHHHPDHYGLAGWMQEKTGAPVYLSRSAADYAKRLWGEEETFSDEMLLALAKHGLPEELHDGMRAHFLGVKEQVLPHPQHIHLLEAGDTVEIGGGEWICLGGEGHAPGHLSFYEAKSRTVLCGDQVLPDITPNIGWMPGGDSDPLGSFFKSLDGMQACEVEMAYPGHREPFARFGDRVSELRNHHHRRLDRMRQLADELSPSGSTTFQAFDLCERLFGERLRANLHNLRFAMSETIAHLIYLERNDKGLQQESEEGTNECSAQESQVRFRYRGESVPS